MQEFIINKGDTKEATLSFQISQHYVKLRLDTDISILDNPTGQLSTDAMDLFKLWFSHFYIDSQQMHITHPHLWDIAKNQSKERGESEQNVLQFAQKKLEVPLYVKDLTIPMQYANHCSVIVMNAEQLLHYDLLKIENIFPSALVHWFFAKLWAIKQGRMFQNAAWKRAMANNSWVWLDGPQ